MEFARARAVITGGASGLGLAVATRLIAAGARVALLDLQPQAGEAAACQLGDRARFMACDVSSEIAVEAAMTQAAASLGGVDLLVNCAGVIGAGRMLGKSGPMAGEFFARVLQVNLLGSFLCDKAAAQRMQANTANVEGERGVIIHTASVAAFEGQIGQAAYSASKAGLVGMTLPLARELAQFGIRVLAIAPGIFMTPMMASLSAEAQSSLGQQVPFPPRLGRPEEFAQLVQSLYENPMMNGATIRLDGAIRMQPR